ncbi:MAG: colanic acid exporter [Sphingobacteriaceae bacterium]|nr:MAG: colanic acid exporter [Sphingobacteriaceae bacterium]
MSNKKKAINGAKWTSVSAAISAILQFGQVAVLARLLEPSAFGIVSISTLVITFLNIFAHFGFSNSIIFKQVTDQKILSTIYYLNLIIGVLMFGLMYFSAPLLVLYYNEPLLDGILKIAAFSFPIVFLGQIYNILLEKELKFKSLALTDIFCAVFGTSVTILLAYKGYGAKALVLGLLTSLFVKMIIHNIIGRQYFSPVRHFKLGEIKEHLTFGIYNIGENVVGFVTGNIDNILIGGLLGVKQLGIYTIAWQIAVYPTTRLCPVIIQISYPIMAKVKDNIAYLKSSYLKMTSFISYCIFPLLVGLFLTAFNVIPLIYGPGWDNTIPLVKIFAFMGILFSLMYTTPPVAYLTGKPNYLFYKNLVMLVVRVPVIYVAAQMYGLTGIAVGFLITTILSLVLNFYMVKKMVGSFYMELIQDHVKPVLFSLAMAVVILLYKYFIGDAGLVHTLIQISLGGLVYAGLVLKYKLSFAEIKNLRSSL